LVRLLRWRPIRGGVRGRLLNRRGWLAIWLRARCGSSPVKFGALVARLMISHTGIVGYPGCD